MSGAAAAAAPASSGVACSAVGGVASARLRPFHSGSNGQPDAPRRLVATTTTAASAAGVYGWGLSVVSVGFATELACDEHRTRIKQPPGNVAQSRRRETQQLAGAKATETDTRCCEGGHVFDTGVYPKTLGSDLG